MKQVTHSEWAALIVCVPKKDGCVRLCGDYKVTINLSLDIDQYLLPKEAEHFATLAYGKIFMKLDPSQAYQQMLLSDESAKYNTLTLVYSSTPGCHSALRLPLLFFKRLWTNGISGVICYIDDVLITGKTEAEHLDRLEAVLKRLREHGLRLRKNKCEYMRPTVEYLGHLIDAIGKHLSPSKVEAIVNALAPTNVQQLRAFLGLVNYYSKFVANLSTILSPLNRLLGQIMKWKWTQECLF